MVTEEMINRAKSLLSVLPESEAAQVMIDEGMSVEDSVLSTIAASVFYKMENKEE